MRQVGVRGEGREGQVDGWGGLGVGKVEGVGVERAAKGGRCLASIGLPACVLTSGGQSAEKPSGLISNLFCKFWIRQKLQNR